MGILSITDFRSSDTCGNNGGILIFEKSTLEYPHHVMPTAGESHDYNHCESCQESIKNITGDLTQRFNGYNDKKPFPECCEWHRSLLSIENFDRGKYVDAPRMTAEKIIFTKQHIINHINNLDWYEDIVDYIVYCVDSFGSMPENCGVPLYLQDYYGCVERHIKENKDYPTEKTKKLLDFLERAKQPNDINESLKTITDTYQKWINLFPFELNNMFGQEFKVLKNRLPFFVYKPRPCKYGDNIDYTEFHTNFTLAEYLCTLTSILLGKINSHELVKQGVISDIDKQTFETAGVELRVRNDLNLRDYSQAEKKYGDTILQWLENQRRYFDAIKPLLNSVSQKALPPGVCIASVEHKTDEFLNYFSGRCSREFRDRLIRDMDTILLSNPNGRQITAIASVIYNSDKLHPATKPKTFNRWLEVFSKCWNATKPTSKPGAVKKEITDAKSTFYYVADDFPKIAG